MSSTVTSNHVVYRWMQAVNARRIDDVLALYAPEAVLLPTFSPHALRTVEAKRQYFELLASRPGMAVSLHEKTLHVQRLSGGTEVVCGIYRFQVEIDEEPLVFEARFSFLIDNTRESPVLHHHSSQIPRTLS